MEEALEVIWEARTEHRRHCKDSANQSRWSDSFICEKCLGFEEAYNAVKNRMNYNLAAPARKAWIAEVRRRKQT